MIRLLLDRLDVDETALRDRYPFASLVREVGGIVEGVRAIPLDVSAPRFEAAVAPLNALSATWSHVSSRDEDSIGGAGADVDRQLAWVRAAVEAVERYSSCVHLPEELVVASADDLGDGALDLDAVPRCSQREYQDPACPLRPADKRQDIRWTSGYSLVDRRPRMVPSVMTHQFVEPWPSERFWIPISTGVAAHTDLATAVVSAICEVIERDAIALTWLARLPLARIELSDPLPAELAANAERLADTLLRQLFFDAATDVGVPTVYSLQLVDRHPRVAQYVNCATDFSWAAACAKTIREAAPARTVLERDRHLPSAVEDFFALEHGATFLGRIEHREEFSFLTGSTARRDINRLPDVDPGSGWPRVRYLVDRLASMGTDVVLVDLTTDEVREAGLWVVRAVVPGLMPMSPVYRARFLGHPRLYRYPRDAGYGALTEDSVNPAPQPFA